MYLRHTTITTKENILRRKILNSNLTKVSVSYFVDDIAFEITMKSHKTKFIKTGA